MRTQAEIFRTRKEFGSRYDEVGVERTLSQKMKSSVDQLSCSD